MGRGIQETDNRNRCVKCCMEIQVGVCLWLSMKSAQPVLSLLKLTLPALLLVLSGCSAGEAGVPSQPSRSPTPPAFRYLALGDSYTIGEKVDYGDRWSVQLAIRLGESGVSVAEPTIVARTGWTTGELLDALAEAELAPPYDLVSLLIGVNNQYRGDEPEQYRQEFTALLAQAIAFAGDRAERVIVLSIPDWGVTPFAEGRDLEKIAAEIDLYNQINLALSTAAGVQYIDITGISRIARVDHTLLASDRLHPSGLMYAEWVELALPAALQALGADETSELDHRP